MHVSWCSEYHATVVYPRLASRMLLPMHRFVVTTPCSATRCSLRNVAFWDRGPNSWPTSLAWRPRMRAATRLFGGGAVMLVWCAAVAGAQAAQSRATTEVGTGVGVTILSRSGFNSITHIGAPGGAGPVAP